jgi:hypothetical protein
MHLTSPGSTCSIFMKWKITRELFASLSPSLQQNTHVVSFYSGCGGPTALSVHDAKIMGDG